MTGDPKCPACVIRVVNHGMPFEWRDPSCTGRAGCVRHPGRENPAPEKPPAGADVPVGKAGADIVERQIVRALLDTSVSVKQNALGVAMAEIIRLRTANARLQAEVERLTGERDELLHENMALVDAAMITDLANRPDRAALATRVAEAVREACAAVAATHSRRSSLTNYNFTANTRDDQAAMAAAAFVHDEIIAIDTAAIVAAALAKEGE
jgi:hypothetical protein